MKLKKIFICSFFSFIIALICIYNSFKCPLEFSLKKITSKHTYNTRWDMGPPSKEQEKVLDQVCSQRFRFLRSTKKCYEFLSEDGIFVIKFFKQQQMKTQLFLNLFILPHELKLMREEIIARRTLERNRLFSSFQIAYERLPIQTNTLYLHLNPTTTLNRTLSIQASCGRSFIIEMDKAEFLIQKHADNILVHIMNLITLKKEKEAKTALSSLIDLIISCAAEGIDSLDKKQYPFFGFSDDKIIYCDIENFKSSASRFPDQQELYDATLDLYKCLTRHSPELANHLQKEIQKKTLYSSARKTQAPHR